MSLHLIGPVCGRKMVKLCINCYSIVRLPRPCGMTSQPESMGYAQLEKLLLYPTNCINMDHHNWRDINNQNFNIKEHSLEELRSFNKLLLWAIVLQLNGFTFHDFLITIFSSQLGVSLVYIPCIYAMPIEIDYSRIWT